MVFTIEPMVNMGDWRVFVDEEDGWTVVTEDELAQCAMGTYFPDDGKRFGDSYLLRHHDL